MLESVFFNKLDADIEKYVNSIREKIDIVKPERNFVFERITLAIE